MDIFLLYLLGDTEDKEVTVGGAASWWWAQGWTTASSVLLYSKWWWTFHICSKWLLIIELSGNLLRNQWCTSGSNRFTFNSSGSIPLILGAGTGGSRTIINLQKGRQITGWRLFWHSCRCCCRRRGSSYLCCCETAINMMSMRMPTTPKTRTSVRGENSIKQHKQTQSASQGCLRLVPPTPASHHLLPLIGISVTWMKMESLNSPNLVKACSLVRMCTSYSFPICRP